MARVVSVNVSARKGTPKQPVPAIELAPGLGVKDDAHAAPGDRQVSLLMVEDIERVKADRTREPGCELTAEGMEIGPGSFAENVTTEGIDLPGLPPGTELVLAGAVRLRVTRIGKECHRRCAIYYRVGDCIMPARGIFAEVLAGGVVKPGDAIETD